MKTPRNRKAICKKKTYDKTDLMLAYGFRDVRALNKKWKSQEEQIGIPYMRGKSTLTMGEITKFEAVWGKIQAK